MIVPSNNKFIESESPHSMGLLNNMTVPNPGLDSMANLSKDKLWSGSPVPGMGRLSFDGSGLFGTGLFSGDVSSWDVTEVVGGLVAAYAIYTMFRHGRETNDRLEQRARRKRMVVAKRLKDQASDIESQTGWF